MLNNAAVPGGLTDDKLIKELFFTGVKVCQGSTKACTIDANCSSLGAGVACVTLPDAIGVRVMKNLEHLSPGQWFEKILPNEPIPNGASRIIDGYQSIRVGRTNYVTAANATATVKYTNEYLISYSEKANAATQGVYDALISNWHFATSITDESVEQSMIRDVKRMSDLGDISHYLDEYHIKNETYPNLFAGSYLSTRSTSAWPSWQATLGNELGKALPSDPQNTFAHNICKLPDYELDTCWWGDKAIYQTDGGRFTCEPGSSVYLYRFLPDPANPTNEKVNLFAKLENSGWAGITSTNEDPCTGLTDGSACACFNYIKVVPPNP
jgi:hypothetical protein